MWKEREDLEKTIKIKDKEEVELSAKNICWLKIVNQKKGARKYSPKKQGLFPPSPKKCLPPAMVCSPKSSSNSVHPRPSAGYATALVTSLPLSPVMPNKVHSIPGSSSATMAVAAESLTSTVPESSSVYSDTASMDSSSEEMPSQSHNNNAEMTVQEAKLLLEKYKGDHNKFDGDDITDEELLGVNEAVAYLECSDGEKVSVQLLLIMVRMKL